MQAQTWVAAVTGVLAPQSARATRVGGTALRFAEDNAPLDALFGAWLKDGVLLCRLLNTIEPGSITRVSDSAAPFKQMENIKAFLCKCRLLGVADHDCFETVDLVKSPDEDGGKGVRQVVRCLHSLGRVVQRSMEDYDGPQLGPQHKFKGGTTTNFGAGGVGGARGIDMARLKSQHGLF
jgi:hypothetical protein